MKPTPSARRTLIPTSFLAAALLVALGGCGALESADDANGADARTLFGRDAEQCRPFLDEAEQSQSEDEQRAALERYEACIDSSEHMPNPDTGRDVDSCYDILEAVVRIQDDVSADIIRQLHDAYVDCVYDAVTGGDPGPGPDQCEVILREGEQRCFGPNGEDWEGEECWAQVEREYNACIGVDPEPGPDDCYAWAHEVCEPLLYEDQADGSMGDEAFARCLEDHLNRCEPGPGPDPACEEILREGEQRCFGPNGEDWEGEECWAQVEREYNACIGVNPEPGPDDCYAWAREVCEPLLYEESADGQHGEEAFAQCIEAHLGMCEPGPGPNDCDVLLNEGENRCFGADGQPMEDPEQCWEQVRREYQACIEGMNPDPGPDQCLAEGQRRCEELLESGMDNDPNDEPRDVAFGQCLEEVQRSCFPEPDPTDACVERAHDRCAGLLDGSEGQDPDRDPAESFERCLEAAIDACFNEPDPDPNPEQCEFILHQAEEACATDDGTLDEQCLDAYRQEFERCLMGR